MPAVTLTTLSYLVLAQPPRVPTLAAAAIMLGAGVAMFYPTLLALLVDRTPEAERGSAMGTLSGSFDLGSVLGSLLVGFTVRARLLRGRVPHRGGGRAGRASRCSW